MTDDRSSFILLFKGLNSSQRFLHHQSPYPVMASSLSTAFGNFINSISTIAIAFAHSVTALFMAILAFGQSIVSSSLHLVQAVILLGLDVFRGALGFVIGTWSSILRAMPDLTVTAVHSQFLRYRTSRRRILLVVFAEAG